MKWNYANISAVVYFVDIGLNFKEIQILKDDKTFYPTFNNNFDKRGKINYLRKKEFALEWLRTIKKF